QAQATFFLLGGNHFTAHPRPPAATSYGVLVRVRVRVKVSVHAATITASVNCQLLSSRFGEIEHGLAPSGADISQRIIKLYSASSMADAVSKRSNNLEAATDATRYARFQSRYFHLTRGVLQGRCTLIEDRLRSLSRPGAS